MSQSPTAEATMDDADIRLPDTAGRDLTPRSEGLLLAPAPDLAPAVATRRLRTAVAGTLPGDWDVTRLRHTGVYQALRRRPSLQPLVRQVWEMARQLSAHPDVLWAEAAVIQPGHDPEPATAGMRGPLGNIDRTPLPCARDPEWSLRNARLVEAFSLPPVPPGTGIRIAHPDTGYTRHPEIFEPGRLATALGYDFESDVPDPRDPLRGGAPGHGTATASVIMSARGSPLGAETWVSGAAPAASLVPLRVSSGVVHFSFRRLVLAIERAIDIDSDILSMSLGGPFASRALEQALRAASGAGIISLAAAGNVWPWVVYPARSQHVIGVAATNCRDRIWRFSAAGRRVDLAAPGEDVWRARAERPARYSQAPGSGTSYAVATVAGAAAVWLAHHGREPLRARYAGAALPAVFRELLTSAGVRRPAGWDDARHGAGILDALALLEARLPRRGPSAAAAAAAREVNTMADLENYFPDMDAPAVADLIGRLPGAADLGTPAFLAHFGDEIRFHLATSPAFRRTLAARGPRGTRRLADTVRGQLRRYGSAELRNRFGA